MFTHLHIHTTRGSLLDSILTVEEVVKFASENGMKAIALTDHGSMASFVDFVKECNKHNIKPIIGNEIYEVDDMWEKADTKEYTQPRYHLIFQARGYKPPPFRRSSFSVIIITMKKCYNLNGREKDYGRI